MIDEYNAMKSILQNLNYLDTSKKYIKPLKDMDMYKEIQYVGKQMKMLKVLEKTDMRAKNRKYII